MLKPADIQAARKRIEPYLRATPVLRSEELDQRAGRPVFFKCENLQIGGAFKARGAFNTVFSLSDAEAERGVVTHSSGNHAIALSLAAQKRQIPAFIVIPRNAPAAKIQRVRRAGAEILFCEPNMEARQSAANEVIARTGASLVHPYNDFRVMVGQGTAALEMLEAIPQLEEILVPVSGGGLLAGTATAAKSLKPGIRVIATEPADAADAYESFHQRKLIKMPPPKTIADGLRASLGDQTFPIVRDSVDRIETVEEAEIVSAMRELWEELKIVVEPSSAVPWAAVIGKKLRGKGPLGIILTGGNVDLDRLPWIPPKNPHSGLSESDP